MSCLSSLLDTKQLNTKLASEQNIISNNSNINSASNSVNKLNGMVNKTTPTNNDTSLELVSEENNKMHKNKRSVIKNKYSYQKINIRTNSTEIINNDDQKDQVKNEENVPRYSVMSIDQLTNSDGQLESFFTKIQSTLTQYKVNQVKEKSEIMFNLSRLEDKINMNYTKIDKLMSNIEQLSKINDPANHVIFKNQSNLEIENKHELQKSTDDIKFCTDNLLKPNPIEIIKTQQSVTTDTPITQTNINGACTWNRCVCKLIDNTNTASTQIINSQDAKNQIKYGDIFLCEFLNAKLTSDNIKTDGHCQIAEVNNFSNQIGAHKNSHFSICPKQSNLFSNNYDGNQEDNQKSSQLSVCSKESNYPKNDGRQPEKPKINHLTIFPKQSVHHFFNNGVENHTTSNQLNVSKSVREKINICDFLSSQPIPEWIRLNENLIKSDNLCCKEAAKLSPSNSTLNVSKSYNIERIINESHEKINIVYEITQKPDVRKEIKNDCTFKEQSLTPCNSLNNEPCNTE